NYRPISLLPSISKTLEKIILKQIDSHFTGNNLYFNSQYGFRKKKKKTKKQKKKQTNKQRKKQTLHVQNIPSSNLLTD
ncbi:hypothetical protein CAPTEDRAFT_142332, partial [Capitella teleta]